MQANEAIQAKIQDGLYVSPGNIQSRPQGVARESLTDQLVWGASQPASQPAGNKCHVPRLKKKKKKAFDVVLDHNHIVIINLNP